MQLVLNTYIALTCVRQHSGYISLFNQDNNSKKYALLSSFFMRQMGHPEVKPFFQPSGEWMVGLGWSYLLHRQSSSLHRAVFGLFLNLFERITPESVVIS